VQGFTKMHKSSFGIINTLVEWRVYAVASRYQ